MGRSAECDFPDSVLPLPVVMEARTLDAQSSSGEIDGRVRRARQRGESLYTLRMDRLSELRPDVILTQDLCGVCSVTPEEVQNACSMAGVSPNIVSLTPRTLEEVWATITTIGESIEARLEARGLRETLERGSKPTSGIENARVAVIEWIEPLFLSGLWTPDLVRLAGGIPVGPPSGEPGQRTDLSTVEQLDPDLVILSPCGFSIERTRREVLASGLGAKLQALDPTFGVWLADEAYFSRPGPRLIEGLRLVRDLLSHRSPRGAMPTAALDRSGFEAMN